jgi:hypothetical protein
VFGNGANDSIGKTEFSKRHVHFIVGSACRREAAPVAGKRIRLEEVRQRQKGLVRVPLGAKYSSACACPSQQIGTGPMAATSAAMVGAAFQRKPGLSLAPMLTAPEHAGAG